MARARAAAADVVPSGPPVVSTLVRGGRTYRILRCPGAGGAACVRGGTWLRYSGRRVCLACVVRSEVWNGLVPSTRARAHLRRLARAGVGRRTIADVSGVAQASILEIRLGRRTQIRRNTEAALLRVTSEAMVGRRLVPAAKTWYRLRSLLEQGFTRRELARRLGYACGRLQVGRTWVQPETERRIRRFYEQITLA